MPKPREYATFGQFLDHLRELTSNPGFDPDEHHVFLFPETQFKRGITDDPREEITAVQAILREFQPNSAVAYSKFNRISPTSRIRRKALSNPRDGFVGINNNLAWLVTAVKARAGAKAVRTPNELALDEPRAYPRLRSIDRSSRREERLSNGLRGFPQCTLGTHELELRICADTDFSRRLGICWVNKFSI